MINDDKCSLVNDLPLHSAPSHLQEWYQGKQTQCRHHNCLGPWRSHPKLTHPSLGPWWTGERKGRGEIPLGKSVAFRAENREKPSKSVVFLWCLREFSLSSIRTCSEFMKHDIACLSFWTESAHFVQKNPSISISIYIYPIDTRYIFNIYIYIISIYIPDGQPAKDFPVDPSGLTWNAVWINATMGTRHNAAPAICSPPVRALRKDHFFYMARKFFTGHVSSCFNK